MINVKIIQWEEEIVPQQAGHDVWTEGRTAAWRPQRSLQEALQLPYQDVKLIVDIKPEQVVDIFTRIHRVVKNELDRLDRTSAKVTEISRAVNHLAAALNHKHRTVLDSGVTLTADKLRYVDTIDLYSINSMLDAKVYKWSIRQALNLSSRNLFSIIFGLREAWWGQATSLANVESALQ